MFGGTERPLVFTPHKKGEGEKEQVGGGKRTDPVTEGNKSFFWTNAEQSVFISGSYFVFRCFLRLRLGTQLSAGIRGLLQGHSAII